MLEASISLICTQLVGWVDHAMGHEYYWKALHELPCSVSYHNIVAN